jgi:hypothetical protein
LFFVFVFFLFGGVSIAGEIGTLPKTSLPVAVLRASKARHQDVMAIMMY